MNFSTLALAALAAVAPSPQTREVVAPAVEAARVAVTSAPVPAAPAVMLRPVLSAVPISAGEVLLVHADGTTLVPASALVLVSVQGPMLTVAAEAAPTVYRISYEDAQGFKHEVVTDCKGLSLRVCARKHKEALEALTKLFPKA